MNENISVRISNTPMILSRSFLTQIPFIQNINTYIFAYKISLDLAMELPRPSPLHFQSQDLSSCALFLCLVSWEGSQVTGWYLPPQFWFTLPLIVAHNIDWNKASRTCLENCGDRCKFTPTLSALTAVAPSMNRPRASVQTKVSLLSKTRLTPSFPRAGAFLCRRHSRILGSKLFFECWSYFKLQTHYNYQQLTS